MNELVAGPFDADKLDYMTRDAMMSGVPVVVDIPRLVLKARAVRVPESELTSSSCSQGEGWEDQLHIHGYRSFWWAYFGRTDACKDIIIRQDISSSKT